MPRCSVELQKEIAGLSRWGNLHASKRCKSGSKGLRHLDGLKTRHLAFFVFIASLAGIARIRTRLSDFGHFSLAFSEFKSKEIPVRLRPRLPANRYAEMYLPASIDNFTALPAQR
jgi:hypothetical protein